MTTYNIVRLFAIFMVSLHIGGAYELVVEGKFWFGISVLVVTLVAIEMIGSVINETDS